jgi:hypothetical protein
VYSITQDGISPLVDGRLSPSDVDDIATYVLDKWKGPGTVSASGKQITSAFADCNEKGESWDSEDFGSSVPDYFFQPYTTLALSDLLLAHGAPDEAIAVLTEWLSHWIAMRQAVYDRNRVMDFSDSKAIMDNPEPYLPDWFRFRIASRVAILLSDLGGPNNRAFRDFMEYYETEFAKYVSESPMKSTLEQINDMCKSWVLSDHEQAGPTPAKKAPVDMERRVAWILMSNENDYLRTDANFLSEQDSPEILGALQRRASFLASIRPECLPHAPQQFADPVFRTAAVGNFRITAGLVTLAVSERMAALGQSTGDKTRSEEARSIGAKWLREGWGDLKPAVDAERRELDGKSWSDRMFSQSIWEDSARLATRALSRLQGSDD